ncbi:ABC transporter ATP-binding protein [Alkaliphilus hydrothermalis]|uniref:ABC-2 type transport system ATP-binding protein n=1 Tax=Alkaliphilus hydrothermalis TaxID=1482730 RepID=A0ABS2NSG1_9FIRM|nr:ABC transporter ATP-binding protein [Alkaliphilus hydrothermalis]MBM7615893.1 ABC-2 type transport system ATP-binding protein [Alkaliphilus hydrothermalis]
MSRLEIKNLRSGYDHNEILRDISFEIQSGEIVGLIGENGAGKTTLIKSILGILALTEGEIFIDGNEIDDEWDNAKGKMAYIPEMPLLYEELTLKEHLEFTGMAKGMDQETFNKRVEELLVIFNMKEKLHHFPSSFSKGMRQKVMVMCGLLHEPSILIVDEPFIGLDPRAIKALVKILQEKKQQGLGILMSTHVLDSAEKICDRFVLLMEGKVLYKGTLEEMRNDTGLKDASLMDLFDYFMGAAA